MLLYVLKCLSLLRTYTNTILSEQALIEVRLFIGRLVMAGKPGKSHRLPILPRNPSVQAVIGVDTIVAEHTLTEHLYHIPLIHLYTRTKYGKVYREPGVSALQDIERLPRSKIEDQPEQKAIEPSPLRDGEPHLPIILHFSLTSVVQILKNLSIRDQMGQWKVHDTQSQIEGSAYLRKNLAHILAGDLCEGWPLLQFIWQSHSYDLGQATSGNYDGLWCEQVTNIIQNDPRSLGPPNGPEDL